MTITFLQNEEFIAKTNEVLKKTYASELQEIIEKLKSEEYFLYISWRANLLKFFKFIESFEESKELVGFFIDNPQKGTIITLVKALQAIFLDSTITVSKPNSGVIHVTVDLAGGVFFNIVDGVGNQIVDSIPDKIVALQKSKKIFSIINEVIFSIVKNGTKISIDIT